MAQKAIPDSKFATLNTNERVAQKNPAGNPRLRTPSNPQDKAKVDSEAKNFPGYPTDIGLAFSSGKAVSGGNFRHEGLRYRKGDPSDSR